MGTFDHLGFSFNLNKDPQEMRDLVIDRLRARDVSDELADAIADAIEKDQIIFRPNKKGRTSKITPELMEFMKQRVDWDGINVDAVAAEAGDRFGVSRSTALEALSDVRDCY